MRRRGHEIVMAVASGGKLIERGRRAGFEVYEVPFRRGTALVAIYQLLKIINRHGINLVNTHSSLDAWLGGIAARMAGKKIIRTRHLSTPIRAGLNSRLLYDKLADFVVTTSSPILEVIQKQAKISPSRVQCVPTGIAPSEVVADSKEVVDFRSRLGVKEDELLVGTVCFVRSWKGVVDLLKAAVLLREYKKIKWVIVGGGHVDQYRSKIAEFGLEGIASFTGHIEPPFVAMRAMDIFCLLSTAHEGVSQASLQAAYLSRPLVTTTVGGLPEVCIDGETGILVPPFSPEKVAEAVLRLAMDGDLRGEMGKRGRSLVERKFTMEKTLNDMERIYLSHNSSLVLS